MERCHRGLQSDVAHFSEKEAVWVICRLAELMGWAPLESGDDGNSEPESRYPPPKMAQPAPIRYAPANS
jgi:hypothetical protein